MSPDDMVKIITLFDQIIRYFDDRDIIDRQDLANHLAAFSDGLDERDRKDAQLLDGLILTLRGDLVEYPDDH